MDLLERDNKAITRLYVNGLLSHSETDRARLKLVKRIRAALKTSSAS